MNVAGATMPMSEFDASVHRTLVELLIHTKQAELAAVVIDGEVNSFDEIAEIGYNNWTDILKHYYIDIPTFAYPMIESSTHVRQSLMESLRKVAGGQSRPNAAPIPTDEFPIFFRVKLLPVQEDWQKLARSLIANPKGANQALVSEIKSTQDGRPLHVYNELRYASASEIRIAQELEKRKILFFPLAVGVRAETGKNWEDHREVDFLICDKGSWGILEVAYHPNRYEQDAEKHSWFLKSGVLYVRHFTAERCYNESATVVSEFLAVLAQHKK
jgi:hypothetical protein